MEKVIITGSEGFIGKILVNSLRELKFEVIEISRRLGDITDQLLWEKLPKSDIVIHLAGVSNIPDSWSKPSKFVNVNVDGAINALDYCARHNAQMIFPSTYVYGVPFELPIKESHQKNPNNPYALSKLLAEESCKFYSDYLNVKVTILRFFNIYGAGQNENFIIPTIVSQIKNDSKIVLNDLSPKRDYLHVYDAVSAIINSMLKKRKFDIFNIGSGASYSVLQVAEILQNEMGSNFEIIEKKCKRIYEVNDIVADITHAKNILEWEPKYQFPDGISEMISSLSQ